MRTYYLLYTGSLFLFDLYLPLNASYHLNFNHNTQYFSYHRSQELWNVVNVIWLLHNLVELLYQCRYSWCLCGSLVDIEVVNWSEACYTVEYLWPCTQSITVELMETSREFPNTLASASCYNVLSIS